MTNLPAVLPTPTFPVPTVILPKASSPIAKLLLPSVTFNKAWFPIAAFEYPVVTNLKASGPTPTLLLPRVPPAELALSPPPPIKMFCPDAAAGVKLLIVVLFVLL